MGKYTKISIILLAIALAALLLMLIASGWKGKGVGGVWIAPHAGVFIGFFILAIMVAIGIIVSLVAVIKDRTVLSAIVFLIFLLPVVVVLQAYIMGYVMGEHVETTSEPIILTEVELLDVYEKISGKRPLCVLNKSDHICLLDVVYIDSDTIGEGGILLQYEKADLHTTDYELKEEIINDIRDYRDVVVVHYIPREYGYKVKYYEQCSYAYKYENGSYNMIYESDNVDDEWQTGFANSPVNVNLLEYYLEHKLEVPVIAEEKIKKKRNHIKFRKEMNKDRYEMIFKTLNGYDDFTVLAAHLQERYDATISDISEGDRERSASVKIGESVMKLSHVPHNRSLLIGSLSDMSIMEEIADDFETYMTDNVPAYGE